MHPKCTVTPYSDNGPLTALTLTEHTEELLPHPEEQGSEGVSVVFVSK